MNLELENSAASRLTWKSALLLAICCVLLNGCRARQASAGPSIEFRRVPLSAEGGRDKFDLIEGRVQGARPGQRIVLFAHSGAWFVQPFADQPFTEIQPDSRWRSLTHLGTEYAALLVEPEYRPPAQTDVLPDAGNGVVAVAIETGEVRLLVPLFWQTWWFRLSAGLTGLVALLAFYRFRLYQVTRQLNLRFEERLAERTRIAQELHDTLLQGVISASMQLHVAVDRLPEDLQAKPSLTHVLQLMGQVLEEGRNALQQLRTSTSSGSLDVEQTFSRIQHELALEEQIGYRVKVEGRPRPVHPIIRDEVYRIGREALVNAFRHSRAKRIEVEVIYKASHLRVVVRDDGGGIDSQMLRSGRAGHCGLSGMRERAEAIGARLKVRSRAAVGTEVELSVPGHVAFQSQPSKIPWRWFAGWVRRNPRPWTIETRKRGK
ncbi:MAG: hypothetical protein V7641_3122 [Blastocatellia bacterium]